MNCFVRRTIFLHTIKTLHEVRNKMVEMKAKNLQPKLTEKDIPNISYEE